MFYQTMLTVSIHVLLIHVLSIHVLLIHVLSIYVLLIHVVPDGGPGTGTNSVQET